MHDTRSGSATYDLPTLTVTPNPVVLVSGAYAIVTITPDPGYYHPTIFYESYTYEIGQTFEGDIFRVEPVRTNNSSSFKIVAKDVDEESEERISINVEINPEGLWSLNKNMVRSTPATVIIKVSPNTNQKKN